MVKILYLTSGDEILAQVKDNEDKLELKNPMKIAIAPQGLALIPFISPLAKEGYTQNVVISKAHVIYDVPASDEISNEYNSKFGGIITPSHNLTI